MDEGDQEYGSGDDRFHGIRCAERFNDLQRRAAARRVRPHEA
jgi:hypothetical protein